VFCIKWFLLEEEGRFFTLFPRISLMEQEAAKLKRLLQALLLARLL
jgi:hypothetical protein